MDIDLSPPFESSPVFRLPAGRANSKRDKPSTFLLYILDIARPVFDPPSQISEEIENEETGGSDG